MIKWRLAAHQVIGEDAKRPHVDVFGVITMPYQLRCHEQGRPHDIVVTRNFLASLCEAKVADFDVEVLVVFAYEFYVLWLQVPMDYFL